MVQFPESVSLVITPVTYILRSIGPYLGAKTLTRFVAVSLLTSVVAAVFEVYRIVFYIFLLVDGHSLLVYLFEVDKLPLTAVVATVRRTVGSHLSDSDYRLL